MTATAPTNITYKTLAAIWGNDEVRVELRLDKDQWERISRGEYMKIDGEGYWYDGDWFKDIWEFNKDLRRQELIIWYGQPSEGDFSGQGYVGPIDDLVVE